MNKSCVVANNSLKKLNDDNQRQILNLNSEIIVLEKYNRDKEEYIKELNEENSKQKNEILKLRKNNDVLYKIIYKTWDATAIALPPASSPSMGRNIRWR